MDFGITVLPSILALLNVFDISGQRILTTEERSNLLNWSEDSKQNIWELSGQLEGDIVPSENSKNGIIKDESFRWKENEIPYEFDDNFPEDLKSYVTEVLEEFSNVSCVKLLPKREKHEDFVYIKNDDSGCWSHVGRQGGKQELNLFGDEPRKMCFRKGTIIHEFLHAAGFYHQQSSHDRDDYVNIHWENIEEGTENNFRKYSEDVVSNFGVAYDYSSVMHYSEYAFSKNGKKTIEAKEPNITLGQRNGFSSADVKKLQLMYRCT